MQILFEFKILLFHIYTRQTPAHVHKEMYTKMLIVAEIVLIVKTWKQPNVHQQSKDKIKCITFIQHCPAVNELIRNEYSKATEYKINRQKSVAFLHTNEELLERET